MCVFVYIVLRPNTHWSGWDVGAFVKILALIIEKTCLKLKINNVIQVVKGQIEQLVQTISTQSNYNSDLSNIFEGPLRVIFSELLNCLS